MQILCKFPDRTWGSSESEKKIPLELILLCFKWYKDFLTDVRKYTRTKKKDTCHQFCLFWVSGNELKEQQTRSSKWIIPRQVIFLKKCHNITMNINQVQNNIIIIIYTRIRNYNIFSSVLSLSLSIPGSVIVIIKLYLYCTIMCVR